MTWLIDTDVCVAYLRGSSPAVRTWLEDRPPHDLVLCSVVKAELLYGARKSSRVADQIRKLETFFRPFESLPFDDRCAEAYGILRAQLEREGRPIGANDMMIAAVALVHDVTIFTSNEREFRRIGGLRVESP